MLRLFIFINILFILSSCSNNNDKSLEKIINKGELVVLTRNAATTYYESREGKLGLEYDMAKSFADSIGVKARFIVKEDVADLFKAIRENSGDLAAAGLTHTDKRDNQFLFGPTYQSVSQQLVCRRKGAKPKEAKDLIGLSLNVAENSSYIEQLKRVKINYPEIVWQEVKDTSTESILKDVWTKKVDCTIADDNIVAINRRYFPELSVRFNMTKPEPLAWVMSNNAHSLQDAIDDWFEEYSESGKLEEAMHRYYGYIERFDFVNVRAYQRKIKSTLPQYQKMFKQASAKSNISWTLLAAQAYQESHWKPLAKSPTGVRGMMMLTRITAKELGIKNRLDPKLSISGGAHYLDKLRKRLPDSVMGYDRIWIALAAYNVGMGHIWDARKLAKQLDKNPDRWQDLATVLPLLSQKKYYKNLKYGYARGGEPVSYVKNIRDYQDILNKMRKENSLWQ